MTEDEGGRADPETAVTEVLRRFGEYEKALMRDDYKSLHNFFCTDAIRFGTDGNQYGAEAITASRTKRTSPIQRHLEKTQAVLLGLQSVLVITEFERASTGERGRQTQIWVRDAETWKVRHAHVSMLPKAT